MGDGAPPRPNPDVAMVLRYPCSPAARRRASSRAAFTAGSAWLGVTGGAGGVGGAEGIGGAAGIAGMVNRHIRSSSGCCWQGYMLAIECSKPAATKGGTVTSTLSCARSYEFSRAVSHDSRAAYRSKPGPLRSKHNRIVLETRCNGSRRVLYRFAPSRKSMKRARGHLNKRR